MLLAFLLLLHVELMNKKNYVEAKPMLENVILMNQN